MDGDGLSGRRVLDGRFLPFVGNSLSGHLEASGMDVAGGVIAPWLGSCSGGSCKGSLKASRSGALLSREFRTVVPFDLRSGRATMRMHTVLVAPGRPEIIEPLV